ncbi:MAG: 4'-phosphopantetheinyl transferase superfamily protein [Bacteroidaceae bacterium]|nr:4'-phosphopantetheinyl transferase superfamily protein [Bacteroidaceae bacterium]
MYKLFISTDIHGFDLKAALGNISAARREKALMFKHEQGQRECVLAYLLLKQALREVYGIDENPEIVTLEGGKPMLKEHPEIHFNLSHCKSAVACVIGDEPVGVDVERIRRYNESLVRRVLNDEEQRKVGNAADKPREFIRFWTEKEAVLKLTGEGIRSDLKTVLTREKVAFEVTEGTDFICTVSRFLV